MQFTLTSNERVAMKKRYIVLLVCIMSVALTRVNALNLGVYADGAAGRMFLSDVTWGKEIHDNFAGGCGIALKTPLMRVKDADYRLGLGFDRVVIPRTSRYATDYYDTYRVNLNNLLTYTFYSQNKIGLWAGPQISFSAISGSKHSAGNKRMRDLAFVVVAPTDTVTAVLIKDWLSKNISYMDYTLSIAPVIGIDYAAREDLIVSADAGLRGGVHLTARDPGSMFRYEGFCELAVLLRINRDEAPKEE